MDKCDQNPTNGADARSDATTKNYYDHLVCPPTPPYLKLIADCWEHIFDYLSLQDIIKMGETCKRMHQMAGYYVREFFPKHRFHLIRDKIHASGHSNSLQLRTNFHQYIRKLRVSRGFDNFLDSDAFTSLKTLIISCAKLNTIQMQYIRNTLKNVENIELNWCKIVDIETISQLVASCPKFKELTMYESDMIIDAIESIFSQYFSTLEHLHYQPVFGIPSFRIDVLKTFLEKHTKLKHFKTDHCFLWANRGVLIETNNIQLNLLTIHLYTSYVPFDGFVDFMKTLYAHGFYRTLHLLFDCDVNVDVEHLNDALSTLPGLRIFSKYTHSANIDITRLTNINEFHMLDSQISGENVAAIARSLTKLERLTIEWATIDKIQPFICHSQKLKSINIFPSCFGIDSDLDLHLHLFALNEERKKLDGARPVTIYAKDDVYLHTKWNTRNANLSHVEVRRLQL